MAAGFWIRLGALVIDAIVTFVVFSILSYLFFANYDESFTRVMSLLYSLLLPVFWKGYTVGKRMCGIRIRKLDRTPPTIITMLMRDVVSGIFYGVTFGIGLIISLLMVLFREDKRSLHDLIAGTEVVDNFDLEHIEIHNLGS